MLQISEHHVLVCVGLRECKVHLAISVQCRYQRQSRCNRTLVNGRRRLPRAPHLPQKAALVDPGFVDVDDPWLSLQQGNHFQRVLLSKHQATLRIRLHRNLLDHPISKPQVRSENATHLRVLNLQVGVLVHADYDTIRIRDRDALFEHILRLRLDSSSGTALPLSLLLLLPQLFRLRRRLLHKPKYELVRDSEDLCNFLLLLVLLNV